MVGKITPNDSLSCSLLPAAMGLSPWQSQNDVLARLYAYRSGGTVADSVAGEAAHWGNVLEPSILKEAAARLGLARVATNITKPVQAKRLPLFGSLDGIGYLKRGETRTITEDPERGIYTPLGPVALVGPGVLESKCTRTEALAEPPPYRGPIQVQGLMLCTGWRWAAVAVLHAGQELRIYVYPRHCETIFRITDLVRDYEDRLQGPDWFPPSSAADARTTYAVGEEDAPTVELPAEAEEIIQQILDAKRAKKSCEELIDTAEAALMGMLANHTKGRAGAYQLTWGSRTYKAQPEKIVPAQPARTVRGSLVIKEVSA